MLKYTYKTNSAHVQLLPRSRGVSAGLLVLGLKQRVTDAVRRHLFIPDGYAVGNGYVIVGPPFALGVEPSRVGITLFPGYGIAELSTEQRSPGNANDCPILVQAILRA